MSADITVGILNYKRPGNMQQVVMSVVNQDCKPAVWLWDNNTEEPKQGDWWKHIDVVISASHNLKCGAWASMMALCDTEFIGKIDDDLVMLDHRVLSDCMDYLRDRDHDVIVGICGVALDPNKRYPDGMWHANMPVKDQDVAVDIPKGRFHVVRRSALMRAPYAAVGHEGDITWPGFLAGERRQLHRIPGMLYGRFKNLNEGSVAACSTPGHYQIREKLRRQWFSW